MQCYLHLCLFISIYKVLHIRPEKEIIFCFCWKNKINYLILTNDFKSLASLSPFLGFICILPIHLIMDFSGAISCGFKSKRSSYCAYPLGFSNVPFSMGIPDAIFSITWSVVSFPVDISWLQFVVTKFASLLKPNIIKSGNICFDTFAAATWKKIEKIKTTDPIPPPIFPISLDQNWFIL